MDRSLLLALALLPLPTLAAPPRLPLGSGHYIFQHRFAEQPDMPGTPVRVVLRGRHITVINPRASDGFPRGELDAGVLAWHVPSRRWFISHDATDRHAQEVGGCSDGPDVVDLTRKIYWTC